MADPLNLLGVSAVPVTAFVDERGIVRGHRGRSCGDQRRT
jgi:hypothetical protein